MNKPLAWYHAALRLVAATLLLLVSGCSSTRTGLSTSQNPVPTHESTNILSSQITSELHTDRDEASRTLRLSVSYPAEECVPGGLLLEKVIPTQVNAGDVFQYVYRIKNLASHKLGMVKVVDRVSSNFIPTDAAPKATSAANGIATWDIGVLAPGEVREIRVSGRANEPGSIETTGWATFTPILDMSIQVNKGAGESRPTRREAERKEPAANP